MIKISNFTPYIKNQIFPNIVSIIKKIVRIEFIKNYILILTVILVVIIIPKYLIDYNITFILDPRWRLLWNYGCPNTFTHIFSIILLGWIFLSISFLNYSLCLCAFTLIIIVNIWVHILVINYLFNLFLILICTEICIVITVFNN